MTSSLEDKLIVDLLLGKIGNTDRLEVRLKSSLMLSLHIVSMSNFNVTFEPSVLKLNHLFQGRDSTTQVAHLNTNLSDAAEVIEVLLVLDSLDAALSKLGQVFFEQVLCKVNEHFILLSICEANIGESIS